jgi:carboxypeptidase C (cathepsin A)
MRQLGKAGLLAILSMTSTGAWAHLPARHPAFPAQPIRARRSVSHGVVVVDGHRIPYTATAGTLILKNRKNQPTASMFYVAYTRSGVRHPSQRPITFVYNGGPGSSTVWLLMGGLGAVRAVTANARVTPPPPYRVISSPSSLLPVTDLVFIDAVGTGYSHVVGVGRNKGFWGVDADVRSFGQFIEHYISQNNRWNSPKFLLGESYGTTRSANLVDYLEGQGITCNGVILLSSILNYGDSWPGTDLRYVTYLPSYTAVAWYHHVLPEHPAHLAPLIRKVERFARTSYAYALFQGSRLSPARKAAVLAKLHEYTGLSTRFLAAVHLRVTPSRFRAQLLRNQGHERFIGRLDARFTGINRDGAEEFPDYGALMAAVSPAFTAAFNAYVRDRLHYVAHRPYRIMNGQVIRKWNWNHRFPGTRYAWPLPDVAPNLADAMRKNPYLQIFSGNGYFDLATPFYKTEFDFAHMKLPHALMARVHFHFYHSGHMLYLHPATLAHLDRNLIQFYHEVLAPDHH